MREVYIGQRIDLDALSGEQTDAFGDRFEVDDAASLWSTVPLQENLSMIIDAFRAERYKEGLTNMVDKARFNAASAPCAGAWTC